MLKDIISNIEKENKIDYTDIFINNKLNDIDTIGLIIYCLTNKVNEINNSYDLNYEEMTGLYYSDSDVLEYFENYFEREEDYGDDFLNKYSKLAFLEAIKNTKINFSFLDINQEALLAMVKFKNDFYEKLSLKYNENDLEYIFKNFVKKYVLAYQKQEIESISEQEYIKLLYVKIKSELKNGDKLEDILNRLGITMEYYNKLNELFLNSEYSHSYDEIILEMERIKKKYEIALKTSKINYIEEEILEKYFLTQNLKDIFIDKKISKNKLEKLIKNSTFKLSLIFSFQSLDIIEQKFSEMEELDAKLS